PLWFLGSPLFWSGLPGPRSLFLALSGFSPFLGAPLGCLLLASCLLPAGCWPSPGLALLFDWALSAGSGLPGPFPSPCSGFGPALEPDCSFGWAASGCVPFCPPSFPSDFFGSAPGVFSFGWAGFGCPSPLWLFASPGSCWPLFLAGVLTLVFSPPP